MLVLSRTLGESIMIGNDIRVTVVRIDGKKIRLAFTAPKDVKIIRQEIKDRDYGKGN